MQYLQPFCLKEIIIIYPFFNKINKLLTDSNRGIINFAMEDLLAFGDSHGTFLQVE